MKNEIFIYFRIKGFDCEDKQISSLLDLVPSKTWRKGDIRVPNTILKHSENGWELSIYKKNITYVDNSLEDLFKLIKKSKKELSLMKNVTKTFTIALYFQETAPSITYNSKIISFLNEIGAEIEHDIYNTDS